MYEKRHKNFFETNKKYVDIAQLFLFTFAVIA